MALPTIEIRFTSKFAWILLAFGVLIFPIGLLPRARQDLGLLLPALSVASVAGAIYWLRHLHLVATITPRELVLRPNRGGTIRWAEVAAIEKKTIGMTHKGGRHQSDFICIKLTKPRPMAPGLQGWMQKARKLVQGGYDVVVPQSELSCTADFFIAECKKRMSAAKV